MTNIRLVTARILSIAFLLCISLSSANSYAYTFDYTVGEVYKTLSVKEFEKGLNAVIRDEEVNINNGFVFYDVYCDFDYQKIELSYSCVENTDIIVSVNEVDTTIALDASSSYVVGSIDLNRPVFAGYSSLKISTEKEINIKSIQIEKIKRSTTNSCNKLLESICFSEYQDIIQTAVIIADNSPVIRSNGAARYIDYDDHTQKPLRNESGAYVPVKTAAYAFRVYYESDEDRYAILKNDKFELKYENGVQTLQNGKSFVETVVNAFLVNNNAVYVNINSLSEWLNIATYDKDGLFIADRKDRLDNILKKIDLVRTDFANFEESASEQNVYYVSQENNANDNNPGTSDMPFLTLSKAAYIAKAGDTVIIRSGTYRETLLPENSGKPAAPIVFKAEDGADVTISALDVVECEPQWENEILSYDIDPFLEDGKNQIFYDNKALCQARHPNCTENEGFWGNSLEVSDLWPTKGNIKINADDKYIAECGDDFYRYKNFWQNGTLVSMHGSGWGLSTAKISESENGILRLDADSTAQEWWYASVEKYVSGDYGYITDTKNAIDRPGEWYWEDKLYLYPVSNDMKIEAKKRKTTIDLRGRECIQVKNINTVGGGITTDDSFLCVINGGKHRYISHYTHSKDQHYGYISDGNVFNKLGEPRNGEMGFYLGGDSNAIVNTDIKYSAASGIYAAGRYGYIENNHIDECGYMGSYASGIFMCAAYDELSEIEYKSVRGGMGIYNNTVTKCGRAALEVSANEKFFSSYGLTLYVASDIANNEFSNTSLLARDTGSVYIHGSVMGSELQKTTFRNNVIYNDYSDGFNAAMYFDNWTQMLECYDNVVLNFSDEVDYDKAICVQQGRETDGGTFAVIDMWNNRYLPMASALLSKESYEENVGFRYGYCVNGEQRWRNVTQGEYTGASDMAQVSGGAKKVENDILFTASGQTAQYNIKFGLLDTGLCIEYTGDRYTPYNLVEISVDGDLYTTELNVQAKNDDTINYVYVPINVNASKHTVAITSKTDNRFKIRRIKPYTVEQEVKSSGNIFSKRYAGNYDQKFHSDEYVNRFLTREIYGFDNGCKCLYQTYGSASILYENVAIPKSAKYAVVAMSTGSDNSPQSVKLCVNSKDGPEIFSGVVPKDGWNSESMVKYPLNGKVEPGIYDIYMNISGGSDSDILWFGFCDDDGYMSYDNVPENVSSNNTGVTFDDSGRIVKVLSHKAYIKSIINKDDFENMTQAYIDVSSTCVGNIYIRMLQSPYSTLAQWSIKGGKEELRYWSEFDYDKLKSGENSVSLEFEGNLIAKDISVSSFGFTGDDYTDRVYNVLFDVNSDYTQTRITAAPSIWKRQPERSIILAFYRNEELYDIRINSAYDFKEPLSFKIMNYSDNNYNEISDREIAFLPQWNEPEAYSAKLYIWEAGGQLKPVDMKNGEFSLNTN